MTKLLDAIGDQNAQSILDAMIAKAIKGDVGAADLVLRHAWPLRKGCPIKIALPPIATLGDINFALATVTASMAAGELSSEEAQGIAAVIDAQRRSLESVEFEQRLSALERTKGIRE